MGESASSFLIPSLLFTILVQRKDGGPGGQIVAEMAEARSRFGPEPERLLPPFYSRAEN